MSRVKCSWPTPTVKTGIERALRLASDSSSEASDVSAPSVTMTRPASGSPDSSSRARSSASPSFVDVPSYLSSAARPEPAGRRGEAEEPEDEPLLQRLQQRRVDAAQLALHEPAARLAVAVGDEHAARVVDEDAEEILLRNGRLEDQRRPDQAEQQRRDQREPQPDEHGLVAGRSFARNRSVRQEDAGRDRRGHEQDEQHRPGHAQHEVALLKDQERILEQEPESRVHDSGAILRRLLIIFVASMPKLAVATTNRGKLREIAELLDGLPFELVTLAEWPDVAAPDETGRTFAENARLKALYYAAHTGELTVADDSGLEIDALDGAPGVESARFGGRRLDLRRQVRPYLQHVARAERGRKPRAVRLRAGAGARRPDRLRNARRRRRPDRTGAEGNRRVRLRPHLLLPAVRLHPRRGRRPQSRGESPRPGVQGPSRVPYDVERRAR